MLPSPILCLTLQTALMSPAPQPQITEARWQSLTDPSHGYFVEAEPGPDRGAASEFHSRGLGPPAVLSPSGIRMLLRSPGEANGPDQRSHVWSARLEGAATRGKLEGRAERVTRENRLLGSSADQWNPQIPCFGELSGESGIPDVRLRWHRDRGRLEYDLELEPFADLSQIVFVVDGIDRISIAEDGSLELETPLGKLTQTKPITFELLPDGSRTPKETRFRWISANRYGLDVEARDARLALQIDPGFVYSTFLGSSASEDAKRCAASPDGMLWVIGEEALNQFPCTPGAVQSIASWPGELFVAQIAPQGDSLLSSTLLGGSSTEYARGIAADHAGRASVVGYTSSLDFPIASGGFPYTPHASKCGFTAKITSDATALVYSTCLGGVWFCELTGNAIDTTGAQYVTGSTVEASIGGNYPITPGAYQTSSSNGGGGVLTKISPNALIFEFSTLTHNIKNLGVAVGRDGSTVVVGHAVAALQLPPSAGCFDPTFNGNGDVVVQKFDATGSQRIYGTYLGGSQEDLSEAIALDSDENAVISGYTLSTNFPITAEAFQKTNAGPDALNIDLFVTKLERDGKRLIFSTYLGGKGPDSEVTYGAISVGADDLVCIGGHTREPSYPMTPGAIKTQPGFGDAIFTILNADGSGLTYSTFIGGDAHAFLGAYNESIWGLSTDSSGNRYLVGRTDLCSVFPVVPGSFDTVYNGPSGFAIKLEPPFTYYGYGVDGCFGTHRLRVRSAPGLGNSQFQVECTMAPPSALGLLLIGDALDIAGSDSLGIGVALHVALNSAEFLPVGLMSNAGGIGRAALPIPNNPALAGRTYGLQALWQWPTDVCVLPSYQLSSSHGLRLTLVQ